MLKIIISPAKKMVMNDDFIGSVTVPVYLDKTIYLHQELSKLTLEELKLLWKCSDKLATQNYERLHAYHPEHSITPALFSYEGIQYQHIGARVLESSQLEYVSNHLRILSGFYGILKPFDGVIPYRLEMQTLLKTENAKDLYDFWSDLIYQELISNHTTHILNLASGEYSKSVRPFIKPEVSFITCTFGEEVNGKVKVKGTMAKIARGEMVRYLAEKQIKDIESVKTFDRLNYKFSPSHSSETEYVFLQS